VPTDHLPVTLSWDDIQTTTATIAAQVTADGIPDVLVGIIRGGLVPAVLLSHVLSCREVRAISVIRTEADGVNAAKTPRPVLGNPRSAGDVAGLDVLVTDDVAGTGETMAATAALIRELGATRVRTAVCAVNLLNWPQAGLSPEQSLTYVGGFHRGWVIFPWEQ
jgi:uncharacterized protein